MILFVVCLLIFLLTLKYFWSWKALIEKLPPGPPPTLLLGNMKQVDPEDPRKTVIQWHKQYGPVFTVWTGMEPQIYVTGYEMLKEIFVKQHELVNDRQPNFVFELLTSGRYGILNSSGDQWREQRRFALHTLRNFGFGRTIMEEKIKVEIEKLVEQISNHMADKSKQSEPFDIQPHLDSCAGNIIYSFVLGRTQYGAESPIFRLRRLIEINVQEVESFKGKLLNAFPALRFVPLFGHFGYDVINTGIKNIMNMLREEVELHKQEFGLTSEPRDFTAAYLQEMARRQNSKEGMGYFSEWQLLCVVEDLILAGLQTTMKTLMWSILFMLVFPEVQEKVQKEIDSILSTNHQPSLNDRTRMPYTTATLHEVQRFANIIPFNFARLIKETVKIDRYTLPKNVSVVPQVSAVHFDETIFEDPFEFRPERFVGENNSKKIEYVLPFSIGKRSCLGESLARAELFLIFSSLMQKFKFSVPPGQNKPTLSPSIGFSLTPQPFQLVVEYRH